MDYVWNLYVAQMEDFQSIIAYNHSYANIADADTRLNFLGIRVPFLKPTESGLPDDSEVESLYIIEETINEIVNGFNAIAVARITSDNARYFYFYIDVPEKAVIEAVKDRQYPLRYQCGFRFEEDPEKQIYWSEAYPTPDSMQVVEDMRLLETLRTYGDNHQQEREVFHWAFFENIENAEAFASWAQDQKYQVHYCHKIENGEEFMVNFTHRGTMQLGDITTHTIFCNRKATELGGRYDGWETSVEAA